jgi:hypothetical protein
LFEDLFHKEKLRNAKNKDYIKESKDFIFIKKIIENTQIE